MKVDETDRTRPFAYADPRSLSEAWYDALYGAKPQVHARATQDLPRTRDDAEVRSPSEPEAAPETTAAQPRATQPLPARARVTAEPLFADAEDAPHAALRRRQRVTNAAAAASEDAERSDLEFGDGHGGGIKLLVAQRDGEIEVVAICEREARERTADALARARIALGARGIALHTTLREKTEGEAR